MASKEDVKDDYWHKYQVEMYKIWGGEVEPRLGIEIRYYKTDKDIHDEDLRPIPGKRTSVVYLGKSIPPFNQSK